MDWFNRYKREISKEVIPLYQVRGNEIFVKKFDSDDTAVYKYCVEHKKRWEAVLEWEEIPDVIY